MSYQFKCKSCGHDKIEEVMFGCIYYSTIEDVTEDGLKYGENIVSDGTVDHYQCADCGEDLVFESGMVVGDGELRDYLEEQAEIKRRDEKRGTYPNKEDISN